MAGSGGAKILSTLHTVNLYKELGWTGSSLGIYAIHNWTLTEENGQTRLSVSESMEGLLARTFSKKLHNTLEKGLDIWINSLKSVVE